MNLASMIDHSVLKPDCRSEDINRVCAEAMNHQFSAVCVPPFYIKEAAHLLADSPVRVATVIGFPMGYAATVAKVEEIKRAINDGVDELDVVVNICAVKDKQWSFVKNDIDSMTRAVHLKGKLIKVIFETSLLSEEEIAQLCNICAEVGVDFVKTSTGFGEVGATNEIVQFLKQSLPSTIKIKASGGIRTSEQAMELVNAGATRLGTSSGIAIVNAD